MMARVRYNAYEKILLFELQVQSCLHQIVLNFKTKNRIGPEQSRVESTY